MIKIIAKKYNNRLYGNKYCLDESNGSFNVTGFMQYLRSELWDLKKIVSSATDWNKLPSAEVEDMLYSADKPELTRLYFSYMAKNFSIDDISVGGESICAFKVPEFRLSEEEFTDIQMGFDCMSSIKFIGEFWNSWFKNLQDVSIAQCGSEERFQVGDRVICSYYYRGRFKTGTVIKTDYCNNSIGVEFDCYVSGHDCSGRAQEGRGLWMSPDNIFKL